MKNSLIVTTLVILSQIAFLSADDGLPSDSEDLLQKLNSFEQETLRKAEQEIAAKRLAVIEVLASHMDRETRAGNLEAALALKNRIDELTPKDVEEEAAPSERAMTDEEKIRSFALGPVWGNPENENITFQFLEDGTGIKMFHGQAQKITWTITDGVITSNLGRVKEYFFAEPRRKELWLIRENGDKVRELKKLR